MSGRRLASIAVIALAAGALATFGVAGSFEGFKTPGGAAYCRMEFSSRGAFYAFRCFRPSDGFWVRLEGIFAGSNVRATKGYSERFRGLKASAPVLGFGREFSSSDAQVITCWSRSTGITCKHYDGLAFWLGRSVGYRIYYDKPGFPPNVFPLFRSSPGVWCGIDADNLEPAKPFLLCWQPSTGLVLGISHRGRQGASAARSEQAEGYRPKGFRLIPSGSTFAWRCRKIDGEYADQCSTGRGATVFSCSVAVGRTTCRNQSGRGFWVDARHGFYTF